MSNLVIAPSAGYYIQRNGFGPGEVSHRRVQAESPYVAGKMLVHSVKDQQTGTLKIRVEGSSQSQLYSRMETLAEAFEQFSYTLSLYINGVLYSYQCDAADYAVGDNGQIDDLFLRSNMQMMTFQVAHKPIVSGFI